MLADVGSVSEIVGYLVLGMSFGKQLGLDSVQDVVDYLTLLPCFLLFVFFQSFLVIIPTHVLSVCRYAPSDSGI